MVRRTKGVKQLKNRRANYKFYIEKKIEVGICLTGTEVKALRLGQAVIDDSFAVFKQGELFLINCHIGEYPKAVKADQHTTRRARKLLLHKKELSRLTGSVQRRGMALVPLSLSFNTRGIAKIMMGLGKGVVKADRRADIAEREWQRNKTHLVRQKAAGGER